MAERPWLVPPAPPVVLPVSTGAAFAVGRIICIGQNYAEHTREMGGDPERQPPFWFAKPVSALVPTQAPDTPCVVAYPPATENLHHEVELVLAIGQGGRNLDLEQASDAVVAAAVGLDLTRRCVQGQARAAGRPWDAAKGFDAAAPCGLLTPVAGTAPLAGRSIQCQVNGQLRQQGNTNQMIWSPAEFLALFSATMALAPGDLVFTGTPAGVGPLLPGDRAEARIDGLAPLVVEVQH